MAVVEGEKLLQRALNNFALDLDKAIDDAVVMTAVDVTGIAVKSINTSSQGKEYKKSANVTHIASKEGEAPNTDEGVLVNSVTYTHDNGSKVAFVGTNVEYGALLEVEKNRPWLEPAKLEGEKGFADRMKLAVKNQVKKAGK